MKTFEEYYQEVLHQIEKKGIGVLATANNNVPSTRMLSFVVYDGKVCFQTSTKLKKYKEISENRNVSICFTNINIQGIAKIRDEQVLDNEEFAVLFKKKHLASFNSYSHMQSNRVVEVFPIKITIWLYENGEPFRIFLDMENKTVREEKYEHSEED